ncbi:MAG: FxsA family protein, partial [Planctomycetota bacterium]|nr:FxsA family protein [Planctomycetota bacterium]
MFLRLLILFTVVPLVELWLLVKLSLHTGILSTVALVLITGAAGAWLARRQGIETLRRIRAESLQGRMPTDEVLDGILILVAGAVLLTPGIITDAIGFLLLIPPARSVVKRWLVNHFKNRATIHVRTFSSSREFTMESSFSSSPRDDNVIDVEFTQHSEQSQPPLIAGEPIRFVGQREFDGQPFPLAHQCPGSMTLDTALQWVHEHRMTCVEEAARYGAVLLRGFPLRTGEDFDAFVAAFELPNFPYDESLSNAVRTNVTPRVFTSNEAPADVRILLHHEMAQTPIHPAALFFFCEQPAQSGGETPLCRSDVLLGRLAEKRPSFVQDCREKGLKYSNVMPPSTDSTSGMGRSWQHTFRVETRADAEERMHRLGYSWEWLADGSLRATTPVLSAVRRLADGR